METCFSSNVAGGSPILKSFMETRLRNEEIEQFSLRRLPKGNENFEVQFLCVLCVLIIMVLIKLP